VVTLGESSSSPPAAGDGSAATVPIGAQTPLRVTALPGGAGLRVAGEIDIETGPLLVTALTDFRDGHGRIDLDLREVTFVDVAGARLLVRAARQLHHGRRLVLRHPPGPLLLLLGFFPPAGVHIETDAQRGTEER
jgi:ABC-type transporter Mla MlaB component